MIRKGWKMKGEWKEFRNERPELYTQRIVRYGDWEQQEIYLTLPKGKTHFPFVIWFHGGGMTGDFRECPSGFWNGEYGTAEVRYRTSGEKFKSTDSLDDGAKSTAFLLEHLPEYGGDPRCVFLGGMSAGAYLAAMVGMAPDLLKKYGRSRAEIAALLLVSGQMTTHFQLKLDLKYRQSAYEPVIDEYAPLFYASREVPPVIFVSGESGLDMPARPEENAFLAATLRSLGHSCARHYALPGHDHGGAFASCDTLLLNFMEEIRKERCNG